MVGCAFYQTSATVNLMLGKGPLLKNSDTFVLDNYWVGDSLVKRRVWGTVSIWLSMGYGMVHKPPPSKNRSVLGILVNQHVSW